MKMKFRKKLSRRSSKKSFRRGAIKVNRRNSGTRTPMMRGGIRM